MKLISTCSPIKIEPSMCTSNEPIIIIKRDCIGEAGYLYRG